MSEHAFKVSATSMHTWSQMVTPALMMFWSESKQICIKRFCRSSMSWIFVSCTLCCITPHISKFQAHDDPDPLWWSCVTSDAIGFGNIPLRACLDQLLIAIRSFTLLCDQSRSQARLIAIMNLIANLGIIYATACHASLCSTALDCLSVRCHCRRTALTTIYKRHGEGEVGISKPVAAAAGALGLSKVNAGCN